VLREGGNNRWWQFPRKEAISVSRNNSERISDEALGISGFTSESTLEVNELFDALETTRGLSSFTNTQDSVNPQDGDTIIATNTTPSVNGNFDNNNGLQEGNTF
jgi:hypothetical protein